MKFSYTNNLKSNAYEKMIEKTDTHTQKCN